MIQSAKDINFNAVHFESNMAFIKFKDYWRLYLGALIFAVITLPFISIAGPIIAVIVLNWYLYGKIIDGRDKAFNEFAHANGWKVDNWKAHKEDLPYGIRWESDSTQFENVIYGTYAGQDFKTFEFAYEKGSGKFTESYKLTIVKVLLDIQAPYILLDSKMNVGGATLTLKDAVTLELEGNFYEHFLMYAEAKNTIAALSIVSPDVMSTVLDSAQVYDIELYGNELYIYAQGDKRNKLLIKDLFRGVDAVLTEIKHRSRTFRSEHTHRELKKTDFKRIESSVIGLDANYKIRNKPQFYFAVFYIGALLSLVLLILVAYLTSLNSNL